MAIDNSRALSNLHRGRRKKLFVITLAVEIGNENVQSNNSTSKEKIQEKSKWLQIIYSSSLRRSLRGSRSFKSLICIMTHGLSFIFYLINPFDTPEESMNLLAISFLHFRQSILWQWQRLSLINTGEEIPSEGKPIPFKFFFAITNSVCVFSFWKFDRYTLRPLLGNQWQFSIFEDPIF